MDIFQKVQSILVFMLSGSTDKIGWGMNNSQ